MTFHKTLRGRSAPSPGNALEKSAMMPWHRGVAAPRHHGVGALRHHDAAALRHHDVTVPITAPVEMW